MDLKRLMSFAHETALRAGEVIMTVYQEDDIEVSLKTDDTPLTRADLLAHHLIQEALEAETAYPVLSEESVKIDWDVRKKWQTYWLIDPLDGTNEFVDRNGEFTVNIALIHNNEAIVGVVVAPALEYSYQAAKGIGSYKIEDQKVTAIHPRKIPLVNGKQKYSVVIGRCSHSQSLDDLYKRFTNYELIRLGSSLKMCHIAEGKADLYPRYGKISEWDTAAAQCILNCVGGDVIDHQLKSLRYNTKDSLFNPDFFAWGDSEVNWSKFIASM